MVPLEILEVAVEMEVVVFGDGGRVGDEGGDGGGRGVRTHYHQLFVEPFERKL